MQVDCCQHHALGGLYMHTEAVLLGMFADLGPIQEAGVQQGDQPPTPPGEEGFTRESAGSSGQASSSHRSNFEIPECSRNKGKYE